MPRYLQRLLDGGWTPDPGELVEVVVLHDDWCSFLRGGQCNCDPDVKVINHGRPDEGE